MFLQFRVPPVMIYFKKTTIYFNCYYSLHLFHIHNSNYSIDLYNRDLQTTIILFTRKVSSHKTDWILSEFLWLLCFPFYIAAKQSTECTWRWISLHSQNLYKCKQVACGVVIVCLFIYALFYTDVAVACLLLYPLFYTDFAIYLFIRWLFHYFCFVYHFKNTITIFGTICIGMQKS